MNQPPRTKWDTLSRRTVASALRAWRDLPKLGEHPLARLDVVAYYHQLAGYRDGTGGYGLALRQVLRDTIELLRPERGQPNYDDRRWFPYLIILEGPRAGTRFPLKDGANIIGRAPGNEIRLDDQSVSRQHSEISKTASGWMVKPFLPEQLVQTVDVLLGRRALGRSA